jgi:hypothetical protein
LIKKLGGNIIFIKRSVPDWFDDYKNGNKPVEIEFVLDDELDSSFDISSFDVLNG